jgi:hypothetical protein
MNRIVAGAIANSGKHICRMSSRLRRPKRALEIPDPHVSRVAVAHQQYRNERSAMLFKRTVIIWSENLGVLNTAALLAVGAAKKVGRVVAFDPSKRTVEIERRTRIQISMQASQRYLMRKKRIISAGNRLGDVWR